MATNIIRIDTNNQSTNFNFETTEASTPILEVYVYEDGSAVTFTSAHTAKFTFAVNRDATEIVEVDGVITVGSNLITFTFDATKTAINGTFFASIIVLDVSLTQTIVQSDGVIILKRNPYLDGATALDTTTVINWSLYTNLFPPWLLGNNITTLDCSDSPYEVSVAEAGTNFYVSGDCDFIFILPEASATNNLGKGYRFLRRTDSYIITLQCQDSDYIDDSPLGGRKFSIRNWSIPCSVIVQAVTGTYWQTVWGDAAWDTGAGLELLSSSSSSSSSSGP